MHFASRTSIGSLTLKGRPSRGLSHVTGDQASGVAAWSRPGLNAAVTVTEWARIASPAIAVGTLVLAVAGSRGPRRQDIEATPEAAVQLIQLDLAAASSRLEARLRYGLQCRARSVTSAGPGR